MNYLDKKSNLLFFIKYLKAYKLSFLGIFIAILFSASSVLGLGVAIRELINKGLSSTNVDLLNHTILTLLMIVGVLSCASAVRAYLVEHTAAKITANIKSDIYAKLISVNPYYFETTRLSDITSRLVNDTSVIQDIISTIFSFFIRNSLMIIGGIILLFATNIYLSLCLVALIPVCDNTYSGFR